jgi:hypothetical protein
MTKSHRRSRTALFVLLSGIGLLAGAVCTIHSEPAKPAADAKNHRTIVYDIADLVSSRRPSLQGVGAGEPKNLEGDESLARMIMLALGADCWQGSKAGTATLRILNGNKLEVTAPPDLHEQVAEVLSALRRLADVAVIVESQLVEVERAVFEKKIEPRLPKLPDAQGRRIASIIDAPLIEQLRKEARLVQSNRVKIEDQQVERVLSWQNAFVYKSGPRDSETAFTGFSCRTLVAVSGDRRSVRLKLTQTTRELQSLDDVKVVDPQNQLGAPVTVQQPNIREMSMTATLKVEDGATLLVPVESRTPEMRAKDRVWLLLLKPVIRIEAEERERKKGGAP